MPYNQIQAVTGRKINQYAGVSDAIRAQAAYLPQLYALKREEELAEETYNLQLQELELQEEAQAADQEYQTASLYQTYLENEEAKKYQKTALAVDTLGAIGSAAASAGAAAVMPGLATAALTAGSAGVELLAGSSLTEVAASLAGTSAGYTGAATATAEAGAAAATGTGISSVLLPAGIVAGAIAGAYAIHSNILNNSSTYQKAATKIGLTGRDDISTAETAGLTSAFSSAKESSNDVLASQIYSAYSTGKSGEDLGTGEVAALSTAANNALESGDTATAAALYNYWKDHH